MKLDNQIALVTGGGRGIGKAIAMALAEAGSNVAICSRTKQELQQVADQIEQSYSRTALPITADVTDRSSINTAFSRTVDYFGGLDILVNNAGITDKQHRTVDDLPIEVWNKIISVNLTGTFRCSKLVLPHFYEQGRGNIINVSSLLGQPGETRPGEAAYCASKFGIKGLSQVLAQEGRPHGINVNTLFPAAKVNTGFFDYLDPGERAELHHPQIMSEPALFLASQPPDGITGLSVNAKRWHEEDSYRNKITSSAEDSES